MARIDRLMLAAAAAMAATAVQAAPLTTAKVGAPAVNCVFNVTCKITVTDTVGEFALPGASGKGRLQSRTFVGKTDAKGTIRGYQYRLDLANVSAATGAPCVSAVKITGAIPLHVPLDFNGDGTADDAFAVTSGGLGTLAPVASDGGDAGMVFNFSPAVCAGSSGGKGQGSVFFGLAAYLAPVGLPDPLYASIQFTPGGPWTPVSARAPNICAFIGSCP